MSRCDKKKHNDKMSVCIHLQTPTETKYVVEVLLRCSTESCRKAPKADPHPPPSGDKGDMQVCLLVCDKHDILDYTILKMKLLTLQACCCMNQV